MVFQHEEVFGGRGAMDVRQRADGRGGHVHRHGDAIVLGDVADLLGFQDAAGAGKVRMDDADGAFLRAAA